MHPSTTLFAQSSYWTAFVEFWTQAAKQQNGIVLMALALAVVAIFIITRAKGKK